MAKANLSAELYNLRWNSYFSNLSNVFVDHQNQETLVDVTLSSEGQFIKAHRLILSACSSYFQKLFETHSTPQMLILLNDVKFKDLQLIVQFMYKGEVKVADSEMQQFLALGKTLQVKGLCSVDLQDKQKNGDATNKPTMISLSSSRNEPAPSPSETEDGPISKKRKVSSPPPASPSDKKKVSKPTSPSENSDTLHIPRPPNAFMIFANQWRRKLALEYPKESNKDISVRLGSMWKSLSQETKDAFYDDARRADEEHKIKYPGPKEARDRKAFASIAKTGNSKDSDKDPLCTESGESNDDVIEVKYEEKDPENSV